MGSYLTLKLQRHRAQEVRAAKHPIPKPQNMLERSGGRANPTGNSTIATYLYVNDPSHSLSHRQYDPRRRLLSDVRQCTMADTPDADETASGVPVRA